MSGERVESAARRGDLRSSSSQPAPSECGSHQYMMATAVVC